MATSLKMPPYTKPVPLACRQGNSFARNRAGASGQYALCGRAPLTFADTLCTAGRHANSNRH
jgi:hypothetical protein